MAGQLVYTLTKVNFETLNAAMLAALGGDFEGMSLAGNTLHIYLAEGAKVPEVRNLADSVIAAHDPSILSAAQPKAAERQLLITELQAADSWTEEQKEQALRLLWDVVIS